jgi:hypothetical protein
VLTRIGADAHVDDWLDDCAEISAAGIRTFLVDRPWNRHAAAPGMRVGSIATAVRRLNGFAGWTS